MQYTDVREHLRDLFRQTRSALKTERAAMLNAVRLIGELHALNPWVNLGVNESKFMSALGISRDRYYSRVRAARALRNFPEIERAFLDGKVALSTLGMIESKLTRCNIDIVLENISGKTKREAMVFMSKVTKDGQVLQKSGKVELTITLSEEELAAFDRLREVLCAQGSNPPDSEVLIQAVEDSLEKRDPIRKAKRAERRRLQKEAQGSEIESELHPSVVPTQQVEGKGISAPSVAPIQQVEGTRISAAVSHQVWLRDGGRCTHHFTDGSRCEERAHLELDHRKMRCRGGGNDVDNVRLACRRHNQHYAESILGREFMQNKRKREVRACQQEDIGV